MTELSQRITERRADVGFQDRLAASMSENQAALNRLAVASVPEAVIFDVDGTLCDVTSIRYLVDGTVVPKRYDEFHERSAGCKPHQWVVDEAIAQDRLGRQVFVVTGRKERYRRLTEGWLNHWLVPHTALLMRGDSDHRPDHVVKEEILLAMLAPYRVVQVWDDRPSVVDMWRSHGLDVTVVPGWVS